MWLRAPVPGDAPAVLAVLQARDAIDHGGLDYTLGDLRDEWQGAEFDLASDAVVAEDAGRIVGYGVVALPGAIAAVSPGHEGRGIGTQLLEWTERRQRERGRERYRQWVPAANARARALLEAVGYRPSRSYARMVRRLDEVPAVTAVPAGFALRSVDVDADAAELHAVDAASFAANADYQAESVRAFRQEHLAAHDFDAGLSAVAEHGERTAGFLLARRRDEEGIGFVDILAVHPGFQRRGLGTALLLGAFSRFAGAGLAEAQLGVASDNPRALRLYGRVGMTPRFEAQTYERPIDLPTI
jgi:mycothiol synthase